MKSFKATFPKISLILFFFALAALTLSSCARNKTLQVKGSDTIVNMAQALAERHMKKNPDVPIAVTGGGSGTGIAALVNKNTDIALSSREMKKSEIEIAIGKGVYPNEIQVASDGVAIVTSYENPINKLTIEQLSGIFTGKTADWKDMGWAGKKIVALSRDRNSGTHVYFLEKIVKLGDKKNKNEFASGVLMLPSTQAIVEEVISNPEAIGYIGLGYITPKTKVLAISKDNRSPYVIPNETTAGNGTYPISRPLYFYTNGKPQGVIKEFVKFVNTKEGQEIVKDMGFVPLKVKGI